MVKKAPQLDKWEIRNMGDQVMGGLDFKSIAEETSLRGFPTICMQRNELVRQLVKAGSALDDKSGMRMACGIKSLEMKQGSAHVSFSASTVKPKSYRMVVGADGLASKVRELLVGPIGGKHVQIKFPGWGRWMCTIPAALFPLASGDRTMTEFWKEGRRIGSWPCAGGNVVFYGTVLHPRPAPIPDNPQARIDAFCKDFEFVKEDFGGAIERIFEHLHANKKRIDLKLEYPAQLKVEGDILQGSAALIGQAAWSINPALFQDYSMAIEDAFSLANAIVSAEGGKLLPEEDMDIALRAWRTARRSKAAIVEQASEEFHKAAKSFSNKGLMGFITSRLAPVAVNERSMNARFRKVYRL
uniref:FAD-binding domain-containing protein n=1 Tax=Guillardia theta TaxID=55529 RepID=A0A7S4NM95_GUITH